MDACEVYAYDRKRDSCRLRSMISQFVELLALCIVTRTMNYKEIMTPAALLLVIACSAETGPSSQSGEPDPVVKATEYTNVLFNRVEPAPEGIVEGRFVEDGTCLLFETPGGVRGNPVLTGESSVLHGENSTTISLHGKSIGLDEMFKAAGGGSSNVLNLNDEQRACSDRLVILGEVIP